MTIRLLIVACLLGAALGCDSKPAPVVPVTTGPETLPADDNTAGAGGAGMGAPAPAPPPPSP